MSRPRLLLFALAVLSCTRVERPRYNVLLITLDTFRADRVGRLTPTIERLAREGVRFENAESPVPLTLPAHASILSGTLPLHHGLRNNGAGSFPTDHDTLATMFSRAGYRTGAFVSAFVLDHRFGLHRGFDRYDDEVPRDVRNEANAFEAERRGGETVDRALAWLERGDARPFFVWVHLFDAHAPYAPPAPYPQTYDGEITYVDSQLARLLAVIDRRKTIIAIVGDHGESLGEHGELTHGLLIYEPTLHVPMVVSAPGVKPHVVREPVGAIDLAPTIAALAGLPMPQSDGRSLAEDLRSGREPESAALYAETEYPTTFGWSGLAALRRQNLKLIAGGEPELYDVGRDPRETVNILTSERRVYHDLAAKLGALRSTAVTATARSVDEETRSRLASLGYVAPRGGAAPAVRRDPKTVVHLFRQFEEATWALNGGRPQEALATLEELVHADPNNAVFRGSLARACRQQGNLTRAIDLYKESVALSPMDSDNWYNLAVALQEAGRTNEAALVAGEAIRRDSKRPEAHNALGIALTADGKLSEAEREFRRAIDLDPRNARAFNNLGNVYRAGGRMDDAVTAYRRAAEIAPQYPDPLNGLGVILVQQGRAREAVPYFDGALKLAPDFYEAQLNRGIALQLSGERSAAAEQFRQLLERLPPSRDYAEQRNAARALLSQISPRS